jgi:hypothetical protein
MNQPAPWLLLSSDLNPYYRLEHHTRVGSDAHWGSVAQADSSTVSRLFWSTVHHASTVWLTSTIITGEEITDRRRGRCTGKVRDIIPFLLTIGGAENVVYDHEGWLFLSFLSLFPLSFSLLF